LKEAIRFCDALGVERPGGRGKPQIFHYATLRSSNRSLEASLSPLSSRAADSLKRVGREMTGLLYRQQKFGCPTSRSFFARCGIPRYSTRNSIGVIRSAAEGSAVPGTSPGNGEFYAQTELSSRPERTRISCHAELTTSTYAPFRRERRMRTAKANKFDRKSGGA
jgi:hypothetical protein